MTYRVRRVFTGCGAESGVDVTARESQAVSITERFACWLALCWFAPDCWVMCCTVLRRSCPVGCSSATRSLYNTGTSWYHMSVLLHGCVYASAVERGIRWWVCFATSFDCWFEVTVIRWLWRGTMLCYSKDIMRSAWGEWAVRWKQRRAVISHDERTVICR